MYSEWINMAHQDRETGFWKDGIKLRISSKVKTNWTPFGPKIWLPFMLLCPVTATHCISLSRGVFFLKTVASSLKSTAWYLQYFFMSAAYNCGRGAVLCNNVDRLRVITHRSWTNRMYGSGTVCMTWNEFVRILRKRS